jgi:LPS sulfotransferase NodH
MRHLTVHTGSERLNEVIGRLSFRARSLLGHCNYQRFVVVGVARTGSTLLLNLLNAHPTVIAFGELFRGDGAIGWDIPPFVTQQSLRLRGMAETQPSEFLQNMVFRRWPREVSAVGFKLFYYHARSGPQAMVWDHLRKEPSLAIIHIKRRNILEQYLSLRVAHATNVWSTAKEPVGTAEPISLVPEDCLQHFEEVRAQEEACDAFFAGCRILTLAYEDLITDRASAMKAVGAHLALSLESANPRIVRQRTQPLSSAIANYDELREYFAGSAWESFFRQPDTLVLGQRAA